MKAVFREDAKMVTSLIKNGANIHTRNVGGFTALRLAKELRVSPDIIATLKEAEAK
jgi:ankyrin repeat protein